MTDTVPTQLHVTDVRLTVASAADNASGLVAWLVITLNGVVRVDGLTLRRTLSGRPSLSFPARTDASGQQHPIFRPLDDETRRDIEGQVFARLGIDQDRRR